MQTGCGCAGCFTRLFVAVFVLGAAVVGFLWHDAHYVAPWAYGKPPLLTGTWVGPFQTPSGESGMLELTIAREMNTRTTHRASPNNRALIQASASICGLTPGVSHIRFYGSANRTADDVILEPDRIDTRQSGIDIDGMRGAWRGDTLQMTAAFFSPQGGLDSTTIVLHSAPPTHLLANCWQVPASKSHPAR
jgi:hypothetical protein